MYIAGKDLRLLLLLLLLLQLYSEDMKILSKLTTEQRNNPLM